MNHIHLAMEEKGETTDSNIEIIFLLLFKCYS